MFLNISLPCFSLIHNNGVLYTHESKCNTIFPYQLSVLHTKCVLPADETTTMIFKLHKSNCSFTVEFIDLNSINVDTKKKESSF